MDTQLLTRILQAARDEAATPSEDDAIRVLMHDLDLTPTRQRDYFLNASNRHIPNRAPKPRKARK